MAATATEFPPHSYSTSFFSRNVLKEVSANFSPFSLNFVEFYTIGEHAE
jgi:hypothetical protein